MVPKITAVLALATAFAAVRDFDETTLTTKPAYILVTPSPCAGTCEALVSLWEMAAGQYPTMMYRESGCPAASATLSLGEATAS